jgi:zinc protease
MKAQKNLMKLHYKFLLTAGLLTWQPVQAVLPIQQWVTPQGVKVLFVNAPSIPMLDVQLDFDAGSRFDSKEKAGVASLTNAMMAKGIAGAKPMNETQIAEGFADVGAQRSSSASEDRASISLRTLTSAPELKAAIELLAKQAALPSFPDDVLVRDKQRILQSIRESQTKPETIAARTYGRAIYGDHPYGFEPSVEAVSAIRLDDLKRFYAGYYTRDRVVVSMIGAISREQAQEIAVTLTAGLAPKGVAKTALRPIPKPLTSDNRIEHPALQSHIFVGTTAIARGNPDYFSLLVANYSLGGGGFVSRLYNEVREKRGLAYSVYSYFSLQSQEGPFTIGLQTKREQTATALSVVKSTVKQFYDEGPSAQEVDAAKGNLVGGFALRIDNNRKILDNIAAVGFYGLPLDYLDKWTSKIQAVTRDEAHAAFRKYIQPDQLVTVVVGDGRK